MKKEFKIQAISEKVDILEINGQALNPKCLVDCVRYEWQGNSSSKSNKCNKRTISSPYVNPGL